MGVSINIASTLTPELQRLTSGLRRPGALLLPVARYGASLVRKHLRELEAARPNKLGGPRQHWYARAAESVNNPVQTSAGAAQIAITQTGFGLRFAGGVVKPVSTGALAIPVSKESYGVWARDWKQRHPDMPLFRIKAASGTFLAARVADSRGSAASRKRGASSSVQPRRLRILYTLRGSAKIPADSSLLPPAGQFQASLAAYAKQRLETLARNNS